MMAQAIRAICLASATAATFVWVGAPSTGCHGCFGASFVRVADDGHSAYDQKPPQNIDGPCLRCCSSFVLTAGAVLFCTNPIQAARLQPEERVFQSPIQRPQCGSADRTDARDLRQPSVCLAGPVQRHDAFFVYWMLFSSVPIALYRASNIEDTQTAGDTGYQYHPRLS